MKDVFTLESTPENQAKMLENKEKMWFYRLVIQMSKNKEIFVLNQVIPILMTIVVLVLY